MDGLDSKVPEGKRGSKRESLYSPRAASRRRRDERTAFIAVGRSSCEQASPAAGSSVCWHGRCFLRRGHSRTVGMDCKSAMLPTSSITQVSLEPSMPTQTSASSLRRDRSPTNGPIELRGSSPHPIDMNRTKVEDSRPRFMQLKSPPSTMALHHRPLATRRTDTRCAVGAFARSSALGRHPSNCAMTRGAYPSQRFARSACREGSATG